MVLKRREMQSGRFSLYAVKLNNGLMLDVIRHTVGARVTHISNDIFSASASIPDVPHRQKE